MMIYKKQCENESCQKTFVTHNPKQKYCSKKCRMEAKQNKELGQPCWYCTKACGGCSWSSEFKPVRGWKAKPTIVKNIIRKKTGEIRISTYSSYRITECPEFIHE